MVEYDWSVPPSCIRSVIEGVDPALYVLIDMTVVMGGVRLRLPYLNIECCMKYAELFNEKYRVRSTRRY